MTVVDRPSDLVAPAADVLLATGVVATIRPVVPTDRPALEALYERATPGSLRLRFFSYSKVAAHEDVDRMLRPGSASHIALVATEHGHIIGVGCVERTRRPHVGDIALLVDDTRHGEGVGMLLVEHLLAAARRAGYRRVRADVLAENTKMLRVFRDLGPRASRHLDYGVVDLEFRLDEDDDWRHAVERREAIADHASMSRVLRPKSIVVVGASRRPTAIGHRLIESLISGAFTGDLYAINRSGEPVCGVPAACRINDLPIVPDLAVVAVPALEVASVISDCAAAGVAGAVIISDGFAELGDEGAEAQREILRTARASGMRLIGPNCLGVVNSDPAVRLNATFADITPAPGVVGVASQSGGVGLAMLDYLGRHGIGVSTFVSLGNKADVSGNDLLLYWEQDPATEICMLYLESFGNARKFARIAARVARTKPIIAITAGRSTAGARGVRSHTAAAATPAVAIDALFGQAGVIRATSMAEAMDIVGLLDRAPLPAGRRVAILTNGGGPGALAADACIAAGLDLPELSDKLRSVLAAGLPGHAATANPVDTTAGGSVAVLAAAANALVSSDEVDAVMVVHTSLSRDDTGELAAALSEIADSHPHKPLVGVFVGKQERGRKDTSIPTFDFPEPAAHALAACASYAEWLEQPVPRPPRLPHIQRRTAKELVVAYLDEHPDGGWLDTDAAAALVSTYGIQMVPTVRAETAHAAVAAARELRYPIAVKAAAGELLHRTEAGGVRIDIRSDQALRDAVAAIKQACGETCPVVLQPMMAPGVETAVGIVNDTSVGPIVMLALGGVATDLLADRAFRLPPLGRVEARALVRSLHCSPLLFGFRGSPPANVKALEDLILRVSQLATEVPELTDLDLNPVIVNSDGAVAVDVKVRLAPAAAIDQHLRALSGGH